MFNFNFYTPTRVVFEKETESRIGNLVKKGYVKRERSEKDRRVVFIQLTNKGRMAYHHHAEFHRQMTEAVLAELNEDETEVLVKALDGLRKFFRQYHEQ